jgi:predicted nucleic acid-binding protein
MTGVADSSPLIALASISAFPILKPLFPEIVIPQAVYEEVVSQGLGRPGEREIRTASWISVRPVRDSRQVGVLRQRFRIRGGEAEAIILAAEVGAHWLLMDERIGRQAALASGLQPDHLIGTLGILLAAKERGLIEEISDKMDELQRQGFRLVSPGQRRDRGGTGVRPSNLPGGKAAPETAAFPGLEPGAAARAAAAVLADPGAGDRAAAALAGGAGP